MKGNIDKCHSLIRSNKTYEIQIEDHIIKKSDYQKLLGVKIDSKLSFHEHIGTLCKKANKKLRVLARTRPYMNLRKGKLVKNSSFNPQFNYCPLIWILHSH